jgi:AcrR family transcriptional regulator
MSAPGPDYGVRVEATDESATRTGYRRSAGSPRGQARREQLLDRVCDDLAANGVVDFSLRRAARAAGTTHKVLLYYFDGAEDLLGQAIVRLRDRRIGNVLAAASQGPPGQSLADRMRAVWPVLMNDDLGLRVIDQAIGLVIYDPQRYASLGRQAVQQYLPAVYSLCPEDWSQQRKSEVANMIVAVFRGFLMDWRVTGDTTSIDTGMAALIRALEREEAASE